LQPTTQGSGNSRNWVDAAVLCIGLLKCMIMYIIVNQHTHFLLFCLSVRVGRSGPNLEPGTMRVYVTNGLRNGMHNGRKVVPCPESRRRWVLDSVNSVHAANGLTLHIYILMYMYMYIYIYTYTYAYMHIYTYVYILL